MEMKECMLVELAYQSKDQRMSRELAEAGREAVDERPCLRLSMMHPPDVVMMLTPS